MFHLIGSIILIAVLVLGFLIVMTAIDNLYKR